MRTPVTARLLTCGALSVRSALGLGGVAAGLFAAVVGCGGPVEEVKAAPVGTASAPRTDPTTPIYVPESERPKPLETVELPGGDEEPESTAPSKSAAAPSGLAPGAPTDALPAGVSVTLEHAGALPRRELRHAYRAGTTQRLQLETLTKVTGAMLPLPPMTSRAPLVTRVLSVDGKGRARFEYKVGPIAMDGAGAEQGGGKAVSGGGLLDRRGAVVESHADAATDDGPSPSMAESSEPFPLEAVGVGAKWRVDSQREEAGKTLRQLSRYRLVRFEGAAVVVALERTVSEAGAATKPTTSHGELRILPGQVHPTGTLQSKGQTEAMGMTLDYEATVKLIAQP